MKSKIPELFATPTFSTHKEKRNAGFLNKLLWFAFLGVVFYLLRILLLGDFNVNKILMTLTCIAVFGGAIKLLKSGRLMLAAWVVLIIVWLISILLLIWGENTLAVVIAMYFMLVIPAFIQLPQTQHSLFSLILIGSLLGHLIATQFNLLPTPIMDITPEEELETLVVMGLIATVLLFYVVRSLNQITDEAELGQEQLREERALLASKVEEKTADLQTANRALRQASSRKDEFLATMSHELRTPLNVILTRTQAIQMGVYGNITPKQHLNLEGIQESSHHLLSLINDILDVSKIASGEEQLHKEIQSINPIVQSAVSLIKPIASNEKLSVHVDLEEAQLLVNCDSRRIKQILTNLLSNAVKFTPEGGQISISLRGLEQNKLIEICVEDTGIGIPEEDQQQLFEPFTQIDSSLSRQYEGTGLGLSLVKQLTELHDGYVKLESEEGLGSKFRIYLPWLFNQASHQNKT